MVCNVLSRKVVKEVCIGFPQRIQPTKVPTHKMIVEAYYKPLKLELLLWPGHKMIVEAYDKLLKLEVLLWPGHNMIVKACTEK